MLVYNRPVKLAIGIMIGVLFIVACGDSQDPTLVPPTLQTSARASTPTPTPAVKGADEIKQYDNAPAMAINPDNKYVATIKTNKGDMVVELFPKEAPTTVNSFVFLARDNYYDGIIFHRVIKDFMIQGGDPTGTGSGGPGYNFGDEIVPSRVFDKPGLLAMANRGLGTNSNGSQFFITVVATPHLNGNHTIFGRVLEGQDVADAISLVAKGAGDKPVDPVVIETIDIEETAASS